VRADMYRQYLQPVLERDNLQVPATRVSGLRPPAMPSPALLNGLLSLKRGHDTRLDCGLRVGVRVYLAAASIHPCLLVRRMPCSAHAAAKRRWCRAGRR